jgi:hypothetical protein
VPPSDFRWLHLVRKEGGDFDSCEFPRHPEAPQLEVALVDAYYGAAGDVTPLRKLLPALPPVAADCDVIVVRADDGLPEEDFEELARVLREQRGKPVEIAVLGVSTDGKREMRCVHVAGPVHGIDGYVTQLRELEFLAQIRRSGAVFRPDGAHVILPSEAHASEYVRVADMFDDHAAVRRAADWLQHKVDENTILVADTWTIMPLLQELSARAAAAPMGGGPTVSPPVLCFKSYPQPEEVEQKLRLVSAMATSRPEGKALFVMSVASSGGLLANLELFSERYMRGVARDVVAIVNADRSIAVEAMCVLDDVERYSAKGCVLCRSTDRSPAIRIDRKRYFPAISVERIPVFITHVYASAHRDFWQIADEQRAVRLHASVIQGEALADRLSPGQAVPVKRRDIAIDVVRLLAHRKFNEGVRDKLAEFLPRCDLLIVPSHGASDALIELGKAIYPDPRVVKLEPGQIDDLRRALKGVKRILILDDAIVSGTTVRSMHRMLQDLIHDLQGDDRPAEDYEIRVFVIVGRPQSQAMWTRLEDSLRQGRGRTYLSAAERLLLPDRACPWCDERKRLQSVRRQRDNPVVAGSDPGRASAEEDVADAFIRERLARLNVRDTERLNGLADSIFLCGSNGELNSDDRLTAHSLFGEALHEATAYAAVAEAMHATRVDQNKKLQGKQGVVWHWDVARIITAYHDPIIQASFLRAARPEELLLDSTVGLEEAIREAFYLTEDPDRQMSLMLAAEHKWAALAQKHPVLLRALYTRMADEVITKHGNGDHAESAARIHTVLAELEKALLLPVRSA